ncbi:nuclear pore complex protein Nup98-Nup96 isoform X1 [Trichosurus vulpecula]|uniref:nuclear pore complex protein Nup98-Nup96 isoform X1 n=1 Tax=Trichosurus vulpecula TaxID=9337 RepID=UPI00186B2A33|nr:nuclear pore complex protein Nup98-Nup96 isoform X1 [Trichosurus vulpecula]XP_036603754.1 nuclear pore complex protein Nup98-Nup96 isoform X1 [Trichosurus vulpecula]XP_036603755.1 nuclear pore complex protein Nup98-Nup96 isoform X1 [Trichosurus vulpecula]
MFNKSFGTPFGGGTGGFGTTSTFGQNTGFGTTSGGAFGTSAFGSNNNTGGLFGNTQTKPGGLFGSNSFSQPATSSTSTGFGFGTSTGTSNSLFGAASTGGGLFSSPNNAFAQNKPTGFGNFGTSTSSGGLFGTTNTTSNPFGGTSTSLFGPSSFTAAPTGTTIKFNPPTGTDTMVKAGVSTNISTKHQCITAMKEYESKSLEELRLEDYQANRKGPQNQVGAGATTGLFGSSTATSSTTGLFGNSTTNAGFTYGPNKTVFGTSTTGFGTNTGSLFGQPTQPTTSLFSKPFGPAATTQNAGFSFGNTNTLGQPNTNTMGLFGGTQASSGSLFGTATNTSAATGFGTGTGLFGPTNTGFGAVGSTLFGSNKPAAFGTTTTSAPSFGTTSSGLFGNKPTLTLGTNTNTSNFGFGGSGNIFGSKTAPGTLGTGLGTGFGTGTALSVGQASLFGTNQPKIGTGTLATGAFGTPGFSATTNTLGFGAPQAPVALTDPNATAAQQAVLQQHINSLTYSPFGDSPLFRNPMSDPKKKEERLKPTNPAAQKALTTPTHYKLTPRPATRVRPKALQSTGTAKSHLFDGLDDDEPSLANGAFMPKKSIKKLVLKNLNNSNLFSPVSRDAEDLASPSDYPENGERFSFLSKAVDENHQQDGDDDSLVSRFYTNPIAKPIPQTPENAVNKHHSSVDDSIVVLNMRGALRNGLEGSSEEASFHDESLQDDREEEEESTYHNHPAGIILTRVGYYTIPSMDDLAKITNEKGECIVTDFTIGRKGYGSIYFEGVVNLTNLNLDEIVHIRRKEVIVYLDDELKPPVGEGLNRRAEVTLDGVWPTDKTSRCLIKSPERLADINYEGRLEAVSRKQGAQFKEYRPETGSWVFKVSHFSKYGLQDSDEDEEEHQSKAEAKKLKTAPLPPVGQPVPLQMALNGKPALPSQSQSPEVEELGRVVELDSDMIDITQEPVLDSIVEEIVPEEQEPVSASTHIASSLGINPHVLQIMKASLLAEEEDADWILDQRFGKLPPKVDPSQEICSPRLPISSAHPPKSRTLVGGLLQSKFTSGAFLSPSASVSECRHPRTSSLTSAPSASPWSVPPPLAPVFAVPTPATEVQLKTVGARRQPGLVPLEKSVTCGKGKLLMDMALFMGRSFRVGWGPNWTFVNSGDQLSACQEPGDHHNTESMEYGFLPNPITVKSLTESPFKVHMEKLSLRQRRMDRDLQLYQTPLDIKLKHSTVHVDELCPLVVPNPGVAVIHDYADWVKEISGDLAESETVVKHWSLTWTLCEAIWGHLKELEDQLDEPSEYVQSLERRRAFSRWLSQTAADRIEEEVALSRQDNPVEAVFSYLTGKRISEACRLAQQSGDHRLALLLSQLGGSQPVRELLTMQLVDWHGLQADCFIQEDRLRIFTLLAGKPVWQLSEQKSINVCSQLDWKRSIAVHFWYLLPPTASISQALSMYEEAFQNTSESEKYACCPLPSYLEDSGCVLEDDDTRRPLRDVCFHLLKLYSDRHYDLNQLLDPQSITSDPLDYRLSWHLWEVLQALNYTHLSEQCEGVLHASYAAQLESEGLWEWAIFVLLHITNTSMREKAVRELLTRHCTLSETPESWAKESFLTEKLCVPAEWIHEAKAVRAHMECDQHLEALYLFKAGHWNHCHKLVIRHLASDAIINENYSYLKGFLEDLSPPERSSLIQDWDTAGLVYLDYIRVIEMLSQIQQLDCPGYELEKLHTKVTSLCNRIEQIHCSNAKDRLAQSDMAKRVANILRVVLSLQQAPEGAPDSPADLQRVPLRLLAPHIGRLPMPEDYALEELRSLTQSYLRELTVGSQ